MTLRKFNAGNEVTVQNTGNTFTTYEDFVEVHEVENFRRGDLPKAGETYTVVRSGFHHSSGQRVLVVIQAKNKQCFVIGQEGLCLKQTQEEEELQTLREQNQKLRANIREIQNKLDSLLLI